MQSFDKILWRINGLIIVLFASLGIVFLTYLLFGAFIDTTRGREVTNIVNNSSEIKKNEHLYLGDFEDIRETKLFIAPLFLSQRYDRNYYEKSTSSIKNYLFFDVETNSQNWLFENHNYLILEKKALLKEKDNFNSKIVGFIFKIVKSDTNKDNLINHNDDKSIYISNNFGKNLKLVLKKYDKLLGINQYTNDKVVIFYLLDKKLYNLKIDLNSFEVIQNQLIKDNILR